MKKPGHFVRLLGRNLLIGLRAALFLRVRWERVAASWLLIAALMLLTLTPSLIAQLIEVGPNGQFYGYGLPGALFTFTSLFLLAVLAAKLLDGDRLVAPLIVVLVCASIAIDILTYALFAVLIRFDPFVFERAPNLAYLRGNWLALACAVVLLRLGTRPRGRRWMVSILTGLLAGLSVNLIWQDRTLWDVAYDDETFAAEADRFAVISDEVIYQQPKLLAERLATLRPGTDDSDDLYFLGIAGYGSERVFVREVRSVGRIMRRFAEPAHSLLLINSFETLQSEPIASLTSIREALTRIGEVMDRDNDVLFVYLTSHGSENHRFSLQLPPLRIADLEPTTLRQALDDAGIAWRVVVISACYSGGFIDALADERTLVITAAASDRTSFGCSDENDYTYFGRAYFEEALSRTDSFIEAFELAKASVTERETREGFTPSNPQISVGGAIAAKLAMLAPAAPQAATASTDRPRSPPSPQHR